MGLLERTARPALRAARPRPRLTIPCVALAPRAAAHSRRHGTRPRRCAQGRREGAGWPESRRRAGACASPHTLGLRVDRARPIASASQLASARSRAPAHAPPSSRAQSDDKDDLTEEALTAKLKKASGANYDLGSNASGCAQSGAWEGCDGVRRRPPSSRRGWCRPPVAAGFATSVAFAAPLAPPLCARPLRGMALAARCTAWHWAPDARHGTWMLEASSLCGATWDTHTHIHITRAHTHYTRTHARTHTHASTRTQNSLLAVQPSIVPSTPPV